MKIFYYFLVWLLLINCFNYIRNVLHFENPDIFVHQVGVTIDTFCKRWDNKCTLTSKFRIIISEAVRRYIEAGERFADEIECFLASKLNLESFDTTYKRYLSQDRGNDDDDEI